MHKPRCGNAYFVFEHDTAEHFEASVDTKQLQRQVQRKIHQGKPGMIGQRKHQRVMLFCRQQRNLSREHTSAISK